MPVAQGGPHGKLPPNKESVETSETVKLSPVEALPGKKEGQFFRQVV